MIIKGRKYEGVIASKFRGKPSYMVTGWVEPSYRVRSRTHNWTQWCLFWSAAGGVTGPFRRLIPMHITGAYEVPFWKIPASGQESVLSALELAGYLVLRESPKWWSTFEKMQQLPLNDRIPILRNLRESGVKRDYIRLHNILQWWGKLGLPDYDMMNTYRRITW